MNNREALLVKKIGLSGNRSHFFLQGMQTFFSFFFSFLDHGDFVTLVFSLHVFMSDFYSIKSDLFLL